MVDLKELLRRMNDQRYGNYLDYVYINRKTGPIGIRQFAKFLEELGVSPIEVPGKEIDLPYEHPGFHTGLYSCPNTVLNWKPGDVKRFRICTPGWRLGDEQISPIEVYPID